MCGLAVIVEAAAKNAREAFNLSMTAVKDRLSNLSVRVEPLSAALLLDVEEVTESPVKIEISEERTASDASRSC